MTKCTVFARLNWLSKNEKRNFRRTFSCEKDNSITASLLDRKLRPTAVEASGRLCIKTAEEKFRILKACHSSETGTYFCMYS